MAGQQVAGHQALLLRKHGDLYYSQLFFLGLMKSLLRFMTNSKHHNTNDNHG